MTKKQYLKALRNNLRGLAKEDVETIMEACEEHFREGHSNGLNVEDVIQSLGSPKEMAEEALQELGKENSWSQTAATAARFTFSSLALLFFNIVFVVWILLALVSVLFSLWAACVSLFLTGAGLTFGTLLHPLFSQFVDSYISGINTTAGYIMLVFGGLSLMSFAGLFGIGMYYASLWAIRLIKNYIRMNIHIIGGKR